MGIRGYQQNVILMKYNRQCNDEQDPTMLKFPIQAFSNKLVITSSLVLKSYHVYLIFFGYPKKEQTGFQLLGKHKCGLFFQRIYLEMEPQGDKEEER